MDAVISSGGDGWVVWAQWVQGAWVSDCMIWGVLTWPYLLHSSRESRLGWLGGLRGFQAEEIRGNSGYGVSVDGLPDLEILGFL